MGVKLSVPERSGKIVPEKIQLLRTTRRSDYGCYYYLPVAGAINCCMRL